MTTTLANHLSQIRASSGGSLDPKSQQKAHSQSLLFDPKIARNQDLSTIYQFCFEGFQDLCRLDKRHALYHKSLFNDRSKSLDRSQLTTAQNEQLDVALEEFLSLVSSKLLLKPALRSVEWLVRRFRFVFVIT